MKKFVSVFLTAAMAAASLTGCQSGGSSDALTPVTLNEVAHSIFYAPQYLSLIHILVEISGRISTICRVTAKKK